MQIYGRVVTCSINKLKEKNIYLKSKVSKQEKKKIKHKNKIVFLWPGFEPWYDNIGVQIVVYERYFDNSAAELFCKKKS